MMKTMMTEMELEQVRGATFTPNYYTEAQYNACGIKTDFHFFEPDEFTLPDGTHTNEAGANIYIKLNFPEVYEKEHARRMAGKPFAKPTKWRVM